MPTSNYSRPLSGDVMSSGSVWESHREEMIARRRGGTDCRVQCCSHQLIYTHLNHNTESQTQLSQCRQRSWRRRWDLPQIWIPRWLVYFWRLRRYKYPKVATLWGRLTRRLHYGSQECGRQINLGICIKIHCGFLFEKFCSFFFIMQMLKHMRFFLKYFILLLLSHLHSSDFSLVIERTDFDDL